MKMSESIPCNAELITCKPSYRSQMRIPAMPHRWGLWLQLTDALNTEECFPDGRPWHNTCQVLGLNSDIG